MSEKPELLPCPFCGSPHVADRYVRDGQQVFCTDCGASAPPAFHGPNGDTEERATNAWNRRPRLIASAPDMLEALREAAETLKAFDPGDPTTETGWEHDELCNAWAFCQVAIAKATGEPS